MAVESKFLKDPCPFPVDQSNHITDLLPLYYKRLFPYNSISKWLSEGDPERFSRREISFTLLSDIYLRYQSFDSSEEFVQELAKKCPIKIDIGAIYTTKPKHKSPVGVMTPVEKEIVFDIDMTDYDEVRTCCSGADVCSKCWKFMVIACKILDSALREDFGFKHLLWVFSGRRGIHCWVSDPSAFEMSDQERSTVAEFLQLVQGGANVYKRVSIVGDHMHSSLERALKIIDKYFPTLLEEQDFLGNKERIESFLNIIDESIRYHFKEVLTPGLPTKDLWNIFEKTVNNLNKKGQLPKNSKRLIEEMKLQYSYPRLDINVTKGLNHLLKSPFCVHPKTGKVCVPFSPKFVEHFDPATVPTISLLINEINDYDQKTQEQQQKVDTGDNSSVAKIKDYKKTSLLKAVSLFDEFLRGLEKTWKSPGTSSSIMEF